MAKNEGASNADHTLFFNNVLLFFLPFLALSFSLSFAKIAVPQTPTITEAVELSAEAGKK